MGGFIYMKVFLNVKPVLLITLFLTMTSSQNAVAEEGDWKVTPYLRASGIKGDAQIGSVIADVDVSFSDVVDVLAGGALVHVEAHNEQHLISADLVYLALETDASFPVVGGGIEVDMDTLILEGSYVFKRSTENGYSGFEVGARYWDFELKLTPIRLGAVKKAKTGQTASSATVQKGSLTTAGATRQKAISVLAGQISVGASSSHSSVS